MQAILAGGSLEQLPAEGTLALSHRLGNAALLELIARRDTGPETETRPLPGGSCGAAPADFIGGAPLLTEPPAFGDAGPAAGAAPLAV